QRQTAEAGRAIVPIQIVARTHHVAGGRALALPHDDETGWVPVREGGQKDALHDRENRGVGTDPEREGGDDDDRERRSPPERTYRIPQILEQRIDPAKQGQCPSLFLVIGVAAEFGLCPRELLGREVLVMAEFLVHLAVDVAVPEERAETMAQRVEEAHARPRTREMAR